MATAQLTPTRVGIHNVLIATDFSHCSKDALEFGLQLAKTYHAQAYVVFVVPTDQFLIAGPEAYVAAKDAGRRDLVELKAELKRAYSYIEGEDYHLYLLEGDVSQSILDFAHQMHIDLIVLGTHGRRGLGKALIGSVAESIFRHSPVPVLTLGPQGRRTPHVDLARNILLAADFTPASASAARYAVALAHKNQAELTLLHVASPKEVAHNQDRAAVLQGMKCKLAELLGPDPGVDCSLRVEVGPVASTILHTACEIQADLVVMSVKTSMGLLDRLRSPNSYQVVSESCCPVLTLRETEH